ncbi:hypothetical protein SAMN05216503_2423 [Polaribacter sp. KT25b]|uniref:hypothetical protein n=1 Tax=Polaribacter sp. KT25b TaxID=1855336 RepID=UPI00087A6C26|nr:hypothetical protein [Polaribacter sp. KT25b]SDS24082.1 hypothetical protein SAMN05216503_2423 [Polaribacter sp. KT25b]
MAFKELKENVLEADINIQEYFKNSEAYIKLKSFKVLMLCITYMSKMLIIGVLVAMSLLIISFAVAFRLAQVLENTFYGFLIVGLFYVLVVLVFYFFRDKLNRPLLRKFSNYYFINDDVK